MGAVTSVQRLKELCLCPAVSSEENGLRDFIKEQARPYADQIRVDAMGNLIVFKKGEKSTRDALMLAAHMDEVGLMVRSITEEGYLKFVTIGGIDRRVLLGKRLRVGKDGIPGVIGIKAYHLVNREEEKRVPKLSELYIDIGAENKEEAQTYAPPGTVVYFERQVKDMPNKLLLAPCLDDRIGCGVMLELLKEPLPMDCNFVFTVQEEVGTRGVFGAAFSLKPDIALVLEGTTAADIPSMEAHKMVCAPGKGPVIPFMDGASVYDRRLFELLRDLAEEKQIPWQTKHFIAGGTDAGTIQRSRAGVRVAGISAAVRYLHTGLSLASLEDYGQMMGLARAFLSAIAAIY